MLCLDAHQHFWRFNPQEYSWISGPMEVLQRDFLPEHLAPLLNSLGFQGSIAVQARQSLAETEWLLELAETYPHVKGVVGWVDLCSETVATSLARLTKNPRLVGVRHVLQDETDDRFMLRPEFRRGLRRLSEFGLAYDLLVYPRHLPVAAQLVDEFPQQPFVLDHLAKPAIREAQILPWREDLQRLAQFPNVFCKLSGLVTEAHWGRWTPEDFHPYLESALEFFGPDRLMVGSDWPVCTVSGDYGSVMQVVLRFAQNLPESARRQILGGTCARFYGVAGAAGATASPD